MANEGAIVNAMAAAETELANSKDQIVVLNEEISKYKSAFEMIIKDLQPSTDAFAGETLDPLAVYEKYGRSASNSLPFHERERIQHEATLAHAGITVLENRVSAIDFGLQNISAAYNDLAQYIRGWNILIHGLNGIPVKQKGCPFDVFEFKFIEYICDVLNKHLGAHLHQHIQPQDIERAHLLYQGTNANHPVVIVRFVRRVVRNNVFFNRKHFKGTKIGISDHLTRLNIQVFKKAKEVFGSENTWTSLAKVFVSIDGKRYEIRSINDITNLSNFIASTPSYYAQLPSGSEEVSDAINQAASSSPAEEDLTPNNPTTTAASNRQDIGTNSPGAAATANIEKKRQSLNTGNKLNNKNVYRSKSVGGKGNKNSRLLNNKPDLRYNK